MLYIRIPKLFVMLSLLPHRFKRIGAVLIPSGLLLWVLMQKNVIRHLLQIIIGKPEQYFGSINDIINVSAAIIGVFSFIGGLYMLAFSKEKYEDEMIRSLRMQSFQLAMGFQLLLLIAGLLVLLFTGDVKPEWMLTCLAGLIFLSWATYIMLFHYLVHFKYPN